MQLETEFTVSRNAKEKKKEISSHACRDLKTMHSYYNFMESNGYKNPGVNVRVQKGKGPTNFIE
jgi:site-specific recombinase XerD